MELQIFTTLYKNSQRFEETKTQIFHKDPDIEYPVINIHPNIQYQTFHGFGGTFTEASAYCVKQLGEEKGQKLVNEFFSEEGLQYTCGRVHLDSCDASLGNYSACNDPSDLSLNTFSLERDHQYLIPMIQKAQKVSVRPLTLMVSPWSPPAFMKTNGEKNHGGKLKEEYYSLWAKYICRFIKEYDKLGIHFSMLSLQNEPKAVQTWDSCIWTAAEEREYLRNYLYPELKRQGLDDIQILIWDHNKERTLERAIETISDEEMHQIIDGIALHWYSGDHFEELAMTREQFPDKRLVFSEGCVEYSKFSKNDHLAHARMYAHDIIGDLNHGADTFIHWSLVFDQNGGPNHVNNLCEAIIMCDTDKKEYTKLLPYYYIGHFSRFIKPSAVRIGLSRFSQELEATAFHNPDRSIAVVVMNTTDRDIPFTLRNGMDVCECIAKGDSISTLCFYI